MHMSQPTLEQITLLIKTAEGVTKLVKSGGKALERFNLFLANQLASAKPEFGVYITDTNPYCTRQDLEKSLELVRAHVDTVDGTYFIVTGPKGAGKSTSVAQMFSSPGTVVVTISQNSSPDSIVDSILGACNIVGDAKGLGVEQLKQPLIDAKNKKGSPLTIVIEMDRGGADSSTLSAIKSASKSLAKYATVIIVLSETNGALEFGINREKREVIIWVDGLTNNEALGYARSSGLTTSILSDDQLIYFFNAVGTLPLDIRNLKRDLSFMSFEDIVSAAVLTARRSLRGFALKKILKKLKESPDGVAAEDFDGVKEEGVLLASPELVAPYMENVIMYHFPSGEYRLISNAFKTALAEYQPMQ